MGCRLAGKARCRVDTLVEIARHQPLITMSVDGRCMLPQLPADATAVAWLESVLAVDAGPAGVTGENLRLSPLQSKYVIAAGVVRMLPKPKHRRCLITS